MFARTPLRTIIQRPPPSVTESFNSKEELVGAISQAVNTALDALTKKDNKHGDQRQTAIENLASAKKNLADLSRRLREQG